VGMAGATLMLSVNPATYAQLQDTECLKVLGASTMQAHQKAQQLI